MVKGGYKGTWIVYDLFVYVLSIYLGYDSVLLEAKFCSLFHD